jgi:hypothetical protein
MTHEVHVLEFTVHRPRTVYCELIISTGKALKDALLVLCIQHATEDKCQEAHNKL